MGYRVGIRPFLHMEPLAAEKDREPRQALRVNVPAPLQRPLLFALQYSS